MLHTQGGFLAEVLLTRTAILIQMLPILLSYSSKQACETGQQDGAEITVLRPSSMLKIQWHEPESEHKCLIHYSR